ncbi:T9SS C-terminal target domain-containing protein [Rhodohalobacter sp. SW132]|uniref:T9SS type A sorting domain-containing protein n=1 Tax=Rhodohalobacter sp. SW132 TaxID=2293433 RepID=UPI000E251940|nr:T9SS type A sorting domain-containing protein [Rhodohalobacter sp. SW132]REL38123.1 T9SS C-terminal target domain-containing protein [Rhodohalobacter sp. SW132]
MKKALLLLLFMSMAGMYNAIHAQTLMDFVDEVRGDTLVIKSINDLGEPNSLIDAMDLDVDAPEGRVYELKRGNSYLQDRGPYNLPTDRKTRIVGEQMGSIVTEGGDRPPRIAGTVDAEGSPQGFNFLGVQSDFELKNVAVHVGASDGTEEWFAFEMTGNNLDVTFENVLMEHNSWTFIQSNNGENNSLTIRDSYFLNMTGLAVRRNGGIYDSENEPLRKLLVENSTHLHAAGMMYKFRNHAPDSAVFNRNTFVNASGQLFTSIGYEHNLTVTHNLFVNSNVQAYYPGLDVNETDQDFLPHGIINLNHLPDGSDVADNERKVLVAHNGVFWDDQLDTIVETLNAENVPCPGDEGESECQEGGQWMTQMITMNSRTQEIFDDNDRYPYINEANWVMAGDPQFTDHGGLMTTALDDVIEWAINTAGPGNTTLMAKWRTPGNEAQTGEGQNFFNFDWPVAADLSYSNTDYYNAGGLNRFPIGDLNWFPDYKAQWVALRDDEYAQLGEALNTGNIPVSTESVVQDRPTTIELKQNYPNPFNPSTVIEYTLAQTQEVTLEVFDATGRKVATLVDNNVQQSGTHNVRFNASNLSSGIYFYQLTAGNQMLTGKMTLIK